MMFALGGRISSKLKIVTGVPLRRILTNMGTKHLVLLILTVLFAALAAFLGLPVGVAAPALKTTEALIVLPVVEREETLVATSWTIMPASSLPGTRYWRDASSPVTSFFVTQFDSTSSSRRGPIAERPPATAAGTYVAATEGVGSMLSTCAGAEPVSKLPASLRSTLDGVELFGLREKSERWQYFRLQLPTGPGLNQFECVTDIDLSAVRSGSAIRVVAPALAVAWNPRTSPHDWMPEDSNGRRDCGVEPFIAVNYPPDYFVESATVFRGRVDQDGFIWTAARCEDLATGPTTYHLVGPATIKLIDPNQKEIESNNLFYSGVLLGLAGGFFSILIDQVLGVATSRSNRSSSARSEASP